MCEDKLVFKLAGRSPPGPRSRCSSPIPRARPGPPRLDEAVARAWNRLGGRQRNKITEAVTESLLCLQLFALGDQAEPAREQAAEVLARWTISPPARPGRHRTATAGYLVSACQPDGKKSASSRVRVRGDGAHAQVNGPGPHEGADHDLAGLRAVMLSLINRPCR